MRTTRRGLGKKTTLATSLTGAAKPAGTKQTDKGNPTPTGFDTTRAQAVSVPPQGVPVRSPTLQTWNSRFNSDTRVLYPKNLEELQQMVKDLRAEGTPLKFIGQAHSFGGVFEPEKGGVLISTININHHSIDKKSMTATVGAGLITGPLGTTLREAGVMAKNLPSSRDITIAGAAVMGVHGSGCDSDVPATVADQIVALKVLDTETGEIHEIKDDKTHLGEDSPYTDLQIARLSLGKLAIVELTLAVDDYYDILVSHHNVKVTKDNVAAVLKDAVSNNDHHLCLFTPLPDPDGTGQLGILNIKTINRVNPNDPEQYRRISPDKVEVKDRKTGEWVTHTYSEEAPNIDYDPELERGWLEAAGTPGREGLLERKQRELPEGHVSTFVMPPNIGFQSDSPFRFEVTNPATGQIDRPNSGFLDISYGVPTERAAEALAETQRLYQKYGVWPVMDAWSRIAGRSSSPLSPCHRGGTFMHEVYVPTQDLADENSRLFVEEFRASMRALGGLAHWAKDGEPTVEGYPPEAVAALKTLTEKLGGIRNSPFFTEAGLAQP